MIDKEADKQEMNPFNPLGHFQKVIKLSGPRKVKSNNDSNKKNRNGRVLNQDALKEAMERFEREIQMGKPYGEITHNDSNNKTDF